MLKLHTPRPVQPDEIETAQAALATAMVEMTLAAELLHRVRVTTRPATPPRRRIRPLRVVRADGAA